MVLIILVAFPVYHLLPWSEIGHIGRDISINANNARDLMTIGTLIVLGVSLLAARLVNQQKLDSGIARVSTWLQSPSTKVFALVLAVISFLITLAFAQLALEGKANLIDGMAQLIHARFLAEGVLAAPDVSIMDHWMIQNSLVTSHGWVSQYPPGFSMLLAAGMKIGAVWLIPPLLVGLTVFFTTLAAHNLLADRVTARLGSIFAALSPFMIGLAGAYMSHIAASAFIALAMYAATKDSLYWSMLAGLGVALTFCVRPLSGVVAAILVVATWWIYKGENDAAAGSIGAVLGGAPVLGLLAKYNSYLFGSSFRFGYMVNDGETTNLGFHRDPWGHWYGLREAFAYTSTDLTTLSLNLIESVVPVVALCGLYLIFSRKLSKGESVIALWALGLSFALFFYWHHGIFMGPRMVADVAPAWALLTVVSAVGLVRMIPHDFSFKGYSPRVGVMVGLFISFGAGLFYLGPERLIHYGGGYMKSSRISLPEIDKPSVVFVHSGWTDRIGSRLLARGMRRDSVETALRQNATCDVYRFLWNPTVKLDMHPTPYDGVSSIQVSPGNYMRIGRGEVLTPECYREVVSDRLGTVDIPSLLWRETLPGLPGNDGSGAIVLRDLGPEANQKALARYAGREPFLFFRPSPNQAPILMPYGQGMAALWSL